MAAFTIPGDFTWTGTTTFSGPVSISDIESTTVNINATTIPSTTNIGSNNSSVNVYLRADDLQIEALGNMRFDSAFGGSGNVGIANSNSTHLQLGNSFCAIDMTCTNFFHAGSGIFAVNGDSISLQTASSVVFSADNAQNVVVAGSTVNISGSGDVNVFTTGTTLTLGDNFHPTNIYSNGMDVYAQGGTVTVNASTQILIGGALTNAIAFGDISVAPQVLAFNSPRIFVNSPSFLFQTTVVDLSGQATQSSSGLKNVMMNTSGHLVVSTVTNPSQPFWVMGGNPAGGVPIFGTNVAGTGISMRASGTTFLSVVGATGAMAITSTNTLTVTAAGAASITASSFGLTSSSFATIDCATDLSLGVATAANTYIGQIGNALTSIKGGFVDIDAGADLTLGVSTAANTYIGQVANTSTQIRGSTVNIVSGGAYTTSGTSWTGTYTNNVSISTPADIFLHAINGPLEAYLDLDATTGDCTLSATGALRIAGTPVAINTVGTDPVIIGAIGGSIAFNAATITAINLGTQTGAVAVPTTVQPAGWSTVIWNNTTGELAVYVQ